ncbi:MAG TPA: AEC family transporter [Methanobacterium sp.]
MNSYETIIAIVALIIIGYICRRLEFLRPEDAQTLNKIVVYIAIPSLIFLAMYSADLSNIQTLGTITLTCIMVGLLCGGIDYIFARLRNYSPKTRWSLVTTSALFNSGFLGYPVVLGVFGGVGLVSAVFYDVGSTILFISFAILLLLIYGGSYQSIARRSLLFPPFLAVVLGILVNLLHLPLGSVLPNVLDYLSGAAIPLIMLSLGLSLEFKEVYQHISAASFVSTIRLVISPLVAVILASTMGLSGINYSVTVVQAGMPSAMLSLVLAITYNLDVKVTAACIFLSTALSMLSLTLLILLV